MLMNDKQLDRTLRSIGEACFVNHFTELSNLSLPDEAVAQILAEREKWDEFSTLSFRVRGARRIIEAGREQDALRLIAASPKMQELKPRAVALLKALSP